MRSERLCRCCCDVKVSGDDVGVLCEGCGRIHEGIAANQVMEACKSRAPLDASRNVIA